MKRIVSIILVLSTMLGLVGCTKNNTNSNISSDVENNTSNSADKLLENNTEFLNIDSLDKLNFYAVKKAISDNTDPATDLVTVADSNGGNVAISLMNNKVTPIDPNAEFVITMYSHFTITLNDENGFLAQKLGGTGEVEVVITKNNFNDMITFKKGEQYYSCFQDFSHENMMSFMTNMYVSGFNLVENYYQEFYVYTVYFDGDKVINMDCMGSDDITNKYVPDHIELNNGFNIVVYKKQSYTLATLEEVFKHNGVCDHVFGPWKEYAKATLVESGLKYRSCKECYEIFYEETPALLEAKPSELNVFAYELRSDGYWITGVISWVNPVLTVPEIYDGKTIVGIAKNAFSEYSVIEEAILPSGIKKYEYGVFKNCTSLKKVTLPEGIETIPMNMFEGCKKLEEINIPDSVQTIGWCAFSGCKSLNLGDITLSCEVQDDAFIGVSFDTLTVKTKTLGNGFNSCRINKLILAEGLETIDSYAFDYAQIGEILFPTTLKKVELCAFYELKTEKLIFKSVIEFENSVLKGCKAEEVVILGGSAFTKGMFYGCYDLKTVYFTGTRAEWTSLVYNDPNIPEEYDYLKNVKVICSDD